MGRCQHDFASGKASLTSLAEQVSRSASGSTERVTALLEDILGQCLEAVEKAEAWQKWGRHYVPGGRDMRCTRCRSVFTIFTIFTITYAYIYVYVYVYMYVYQLQASGRVGSWWCVSRIADGMSP